MPANICTVRGTAGNQKRLLLVLSLIVLAQLLRFLALLNLHRDLVIFFLPIAWGFGIENGRIFLVNSVVPVSQETKHEMSSKFGGNTLLVQSSKEKRKIIRGHSVWTFSGLTFQKLDSLRGRILHVQFLQNKCMILGSWAVWA